MTAYDEPLPCNLSKSSVAALAESFGQQVGYEPGMDLSTVVESLGGSIEYKDFWDLQDSSSGSIEIDAPTKFRIYLGMHTSKDRDRFTIGHELGHYVLHYLYPRAKGVTVQPTRADRYGDGRTEYEANWFAAAFLMPHKDFETYFNEVSGNIGAIAEKFKVSLSAATVRAKALHLG